MLWLPQVRFPVNTGSIMTRPKRRTDLVAAFQCARNNRRCLDGDHASWHVVSLYLPPFGVRKARIRLMSAEHECAVPFDEHRRLTRGIINAEPSDGSEGKKCSECIFCDYPTHRMRCHQWVLSCPHMFTALRHELKMLWMSGKKRSHVVSGSAGRGMTQV